MSRARGLAEHQPKQPGRLPARRSIGHKQADAAGNAQTLTASTPSTTLLREKEPTEAEGPFALAEGRAASDHGTADQQAATTDALNHWNRQRVLEALAVTGTIEEAAQVANVSPWSVYHWQRRDPEFAAGLALARRRAGERVVGKVYRAVMAAEPDQLVRTPTSAMFLVNGLMPEWRPNGSGAGVQVNVQVNAGLSAEEAERLGRAMAGIPEGEAVL